MIKIYKLLAILFIMIIFTACTQKVSKTIYDLGEQAMLDNIEITLTKVNKNNEELSLSFEITNKTGETLTLSPDINFKIYDDSTKEQIKAINNETIILNKNETEVVTINYGIKAVTAIYFYSGIVENNIRFNIY